MSSVQRTSPTSLRRNALANVFGRGVSALLWVAVTPFALSRLGSERFGVWSLFFVFGGYVAALDLGMGGASSRYIAVAAARGDWAAVRSVFRRNLRLSLAAGLVSCTALILLRDVFIRIFHIPQAIGPEVERSLWVFAISLLVLALNQAYHNSIIGLQRLDLSNVFFLVGLAVHTGVLVLGLALGGGLMAAALAITFGHLVSGLLAAVAFHRAIGGPPGPTQDASVSWRQLLSYSGAVQATNTLTVGQLQAGKLALGILGSLTWVTQLELGFRVANAFWSLPVLFQGAVIPAAARASAEEGNQELRRMYGWACRWVFALAGFVLAGLWLAAPPLFALWLGGGHAESVALARSLAIAFACATLAGPATVVARGGGRPLLETVMFAAALATNVLLSLWWVPRFGALGTVMALAVSYLLAGLGLIVALHRWLGVRTWEWFSRVALPRFLLPAVAAALLWMVARGWPVETRAQALGVLAVEAVLFVSLAVGLSWSTGDPGVVWAWIRGEALRAAHAHRAARETR